MNNCNVIDALSVREGETEHALLYLAKGYGERGKRNNH